MLRLRGDSHDATRRGIRHDILQFHALVLATRAVFEYLRQAITAYFHSQPTPSILPSGP